MYLAFIDKSTIVNYFVKQKLTKSCLNIKIKPDVDFWLFLLLALSKSKYFLINSFFFLV